MPAARSGATRPPRWLPSPPPALPVSGRAVLAALRQPHAGGAARCRRDGARAPLPPLSGPSAWLLRAHRAAPRYIYRRGGVLGNVVRAYGRSMQRSAPRDYKSRRAPRRRPRGAHLNERKETARRWARGRGPGALWDSGG